MSETHSEEMPGWRPLVDEPVFIFSSIRSGSTLVRVILDSHTQICAPHEMHLRTISVAPTMPYSQLALNTLGFAMSDLRFMLWDRILHCVREHSGKPVIVDKTPQNVFIWSEIARVWQNAQFIFVLRHPSAIVRSALERQVGRTPGEVLPPVIGHIRAVHDARSKLNGITVRYEDLVAEPEFETQRLCSFLKLDWEPGMLDYGRTKRRPFEQYLGDWGERIEAGRILPLRDLPQMELQSSQLREIAACWGYDVTRSGSDLR